LPTELTLALVQTGNVSAENMQDTLQKIYETLTLLKAQEEARTSVPVPAPSTAAVDWRKSLTKHRVTCLEWGQAFKQLSIRYLRRHGLDSHSYRTKYGIPRTQPLAARAATMRRRQVVQEVRPWEKAPTYRKGQRRHRHISPEPEAEAVDETAAKPDTGVPAPPKRQRKTTPKKTARKQPL
jgi:predicted transcriptional regulator